MQDINLHCFQFGKFLVDEARKFVKAMFLNQGLLNDQLQLLKIHKLSQSCCETGYSLCQYIVYKGLVVVSFDPLVILDTRWKYILYSQCHYFILLFMFVQLLGCS